MIALLNWIKCFCLAKPSVDETEEIRRQYLETRAWIKGGCEGSNPYWKNMEPHFLGMGTRKVSDGPFGRIK
jgi:hypothetical protein